MLGKLMKYEFKATWKLLVPMDIFLILMSILAYITVHMTLFSSENELVEVTGTLVLATYVISMFVIMIVTIIYLIYRFYVSVYGDEGYLLHTLPVDKHHIIIAKVLAAVIWIVGNSILIYLSVVFLFTSSEEAMRGFKEAMEFYVDIINSYSRVTGFSIFMTFVASLITVIARILKVTACISLGQLSSNHKVLASFGFYYGIYVVQRIFTIIYIMTISIVNRTSNNGSLTSSLFGVGWEFALISGLIYSVIFYFLTWYVMEKKLNLD
ncbi:MAG: hypothetical protein J1E98_01970 [Lachnospiraceae bacterium]|nr:hypothetical protein [Lachnospiraceae bacterium]